MIVTVKLFALARQLVGSESTTVEVTEPANVAGLRLAIAAQLPALAGVGDGWMIAVDTAYAGPNTPLLPDSEVALIPPVSGG